MGLGLGLGLGLVLGSGLGLGFGLDSALGVSVLQVEEGHEARRHACGLGQLSLGQEAPVVRVGAL